MRIMCLKCVRHSKKFGKWMITGKNTGVHANFVIRWVIREYWKFQNVIDKAIKVASEKGMDIDDHFNHVVEMVKLGSGSFCKVEAFHLSRMACIIISENADSRKLLVKQARAYFSQSVSTTELMQNSLESTSYYIRLRKVRLALK